jgi:hypothetical protein
MLLALIGGCASEVGTKRFSDLLHRYPPTWDPLATRELSPAATLPLSAIGKQVTIIVHPAYSLFFRDESRSTYSEAKYDLLEYQLSHEARFITDISKNNNLLVLVLPGNYEKDSIAPRSHTSYLNTVTGGRPNVYYIFSETSLSEVLPLDATMALFSFLRNIKTSRILIGGGYIGRCQKEFFNHLTKYVEKIGIYIMPEMSSISPDDISSVKAGEILEALRRGDYRQIAEFIVEKTDGRTNILPPSDRHLFGKGGRI